MTLALARTGMETALKTIVKLNVHKQVPVALGKLPAAIMDLSDGDFLVDLGGSAVMWAFKVVVLVAERDAKVAHDELDNYIEKSGSKSIKAAIEAGTVADGAVVRLVSNAGFVVYRGKTYVGAEFDVGVKDSDGTLVDASKSVFRITDTGGTLRDLSAFVVDIIGLPGERPLAPCTSFADPGEWSVALKENVIFRAILNWSKDASTGSDTVLGPLRSHSAAVAFDYGPGGNASGDIKYSGDCWVLDYAIRSVIGGIVTAIADFQVQGAVARGTY